ncbi:hypothetical protein [Novipirellula artificiosorum]|uniref:Uncharacterized protein n=1 Tax=Novipirellula artificiosorum TaxID=2528016 RepID=A0A5C6DBB5_9BACT|nr:hypothetical protein [Novipirellula artificiosorum]TWU32189.1 hypothetical protein Poly41_56740 [Novipirellula artificiosorum]
MSSRIPGPIRNAGICMIDDGTLVRTQSPLPGPIGRVTNIERMSLEDRFERVLYLTAAKLPGEIREEFVAILTPTNIAITAGVLAAWAASHYFGVGFIVDIILLVVGAILVGWQVFSAARDLYDCVRITSSAKTSADLDRAAAHLANFIAVVGVTAFMAVIAKGAKGQVSKLGQLVKNRSYYMKVLGWSQKPDGVLRKLDDVIGFFIRNGDQIRQFEGGLKQSVMNDYIKGIDFSDTVLVKRLNSSSAIKSIYGNSDKKLRLIQYTDQYQTNFFTIPGTSAGNLAIPKFDEKKFRIYEVVGNVEVLITKTAPMGRNLSGGAYQVIVPNPASKLRLIRKGLE